MHLLLIEDDSRLSDYLNKALRREGHSVDICASIDETEAYLASSLNEEPAVVILDRMLGRQDGATIIPQLKQRYPKTGILILSSLDMPSEKARIIDSGADEYLSKPFSLDELSARLRLVARRLGGGPAHEAADTAVRVLGNLKLDFKLQHASVANAKLDLTRREYQLLSLLMDRPGRVYSRFQILDRVWEIEGSQDSNVVETTIKNIRRKLADAGCDVRIESKRNIGYWIEA